jgi:integrase
MENDTWVELREVARGEGRASEAGWGFDSALKELSELRRMLQKDRPQGKTFGELAAEWLPRVSKVRARPKEEEWRVGHMKPLLGLREGELSKARIEDLFGDLLAPHGPLSPVSVNKVRSTGRLIVEDARGNGLWAGVNPFALTKPLKRQRRVYVTLSAEEAAQVLPWFKEARHRLLVLAMVLTGMRPGEAMGLQRDDVDLKRKMMRVRRSHHRNRTKSGVEREFPIHEQLVPVLREAMAASRCNLVFPGASGKKRQRPDTKLTRTLQFALGKAGVVTGYDYVCRRKGCGHREHHEDPLLHGKPCPQCGYKLLAIPLPRLLRFYDLRHTAATIYRQAGTDRMVIQGMLGHSMNLTDGTYTHLDPEYKRTEINKLKLPL